MKFESEKIHRMRKYLVDIFGQEDHQLQLTEIKIQGQHARVDKQKLAREHNL